MEAKFKVHSRDYGNCHLWKLQLFRDVVYWIFYHYKNIAIKTGLVLEKSMDKKEKVKKQNKTNSQQKFK